MAITRTSTFYLQSPYLRIFHLGTSENAAPCFVCRKIMIAKRQSFQQNRSYAPKSKRTAEPGDPNLSPRSNHTSNSSSKLQGASMQASSKGKTSRELFLLRCASLLKSGSPKKGCPGYPWFMIVFAIVIPRVWTDPFQSRTHWTGNACKMRRK